MHAPREDTVAWYKQFWPWFILSIPGGTIVAAIITINIAIESNDGLVTDDYYKKGLAMHKDASLSAKARELGIAGQFTYEQETGAVKLALSANQALNNETIQLQIAHPTQANMDQTVTMTSMGQQTFFGKIDALRDANWKLLAFPNTADWRIEGRMDSRKGIATLD